MSQINPFNHDLNFKSDEMYLVIFGVPIGKGRPRVTTRGGFARAYTPQRTANYESLVVDSYYKQIPSRYQLEGPIEASIEAYFPIPSGTSKKNKLLMLDNKIMHTHKPDIDNIEKSVLDALNEKAYKDDSLIVRVKAEKFYSDIPRVEIRLKEIEKNDGYDETS